jgi:hypothetical protein
MKRKHEKVYQFKITLTGIEPPIWRRIQVSETYSFWDLHVAIQDAMGWSDTHLHEFRLFNPATGLMEWIGIPGEEFEGEPEVYPGWTRKIAGYFPVAGTTVEYTYDLGDNWEHTIEMERILPWENGVHYPLCIDGKRACPPEDCGGIEGFHDFLEAVLILGHEDRGKTLTWVGGQYDIGKFDSKEVIFDDPRKRWKAAFQGN